MSAELEVLEAALGHRFRDRQFLRRALTHKSRAYEQGEPEVVADNEQLEFLGDSILGFVVSEWLVARFPAYPEGRLSKLKAHLVSSAHLYQAAQVIHMGNHLILGRGEELSGGREKKALLANAMEAVLAAVYLDGGMEPARHFVITRILSDFDAENHNGDTIVDYKSALQEYARSLRLPPPRYAIVAEHGPEHAKTFTVEVSVGRNFVARSEGLSKKSAGQQAAQAVLTLLKSST